MGLNLSDGYSRFIDMHAYYAISSMMRSAAFPFIHEISFLRFVGFGLILVHRALLACRNFDNLCELEDNAVGCTPFSLRVNYKRFLHFGTHLLFLLHLTDTSSLLFFFLAYGLGDWSSTVFCDGMDLKRMVLGQLNKIHVFRVFI